jgi:ATP-dependent Clp protease ATP-binding subunit ClpA
VVDEELRGFGAGARRAVALAELEARHLDHDRVGTEHLLLGLLADEASPAASVLLDAGVTLSAARRKVTEAVGAEPPAAARPDGPLPRTPRAARSLGRAVRFAHARRAEEIGTEHVLLGVLDVEGTAGQVLRGLGVDVDRVRSRLDGVEVVDAPERTVPVTVTCPVCAATLDDALEYSIVTARGEGGGRAVLVLSCGACGTFLGITSGQ